MVAYIRGSQSGGIELGGDREPLASRATTGPPVVGRAGPWQHGVPGLRPRHGLLGQARARPKKRVSGRDVMPWAAWTYIEESIPLDTNIPALPAYAVEAPNAHPEKQFYSTLLQYC
jgi:hypothetical protein